MKSTTAVVVLCLAFCAHAGVAQKPSGPSSRPWAELDSAIPIASSFSGGISLGAYQSGVNWGLTQFLKVARSDPSYRIGRRLPELFFASLTGASAGNINAVLSAIEYCDTRLSPPDSSLLWKMWITTGWPQLFPDDRSGDPESGLLDRRHFKNYVMREVSKAMGQGTFVPGCRIPIGIVVTKLVPGRIPLDTTISLPAQRYVAMFEVRVAGGRMQFARPQDALLADRSLGARLSLYHDASVFLDEETVFAVTEASSAYPIAFAEKRLTYRDPDCQLYPPPHRPCNTMINDVFIDGGVFDNNPVGLAHRMFVRRDVTDFPLPVARKGVSRVPRLVYVDPSAFRGRLAALANAADANRARSGTGGFTSVIRLITGFVPSARTYELQSFARGMIGSEDAPFITATTRAHPLIGEHLNAFAGFLGRPFREFDFYVGVSDAIHYIAMDILCDPARVSARELASARSARDSANIRSEQQARNPADRAVQQRACFRAEYRDLLKSRLKLSASYDQIVIAKIAKETDPDLLPDTTAELRDSFSPQDSLKSKPWSDAAKRHPDSVLRAQRIAVAFALQKATASLMLNPPPRCETADLITETLCADRFGEILRDFGTPQIRNTLALWAANCRKTRGRFAGDCLADEPMVDLVSDPNKMLRNTFLSMLSRLREVEGARKARGEENFKLTVKLAEMAYRSTDATVRRGLEIDPSSIAPEKSLWALMSLLPYYAGVGMGVPSFEFGWQPTFHFSNHLIAVLPIGISKFKDGTPQREYHWYSAVSPGLGIKFRNLLVSQVQVNLRFTSRLDGGWTSQGKPTWEVGALVVGGKGRVTVFRLPERLAGDRSFRYAGTIALADVNGLLYWVTR